MARNTESTIPHRDADFDGWFENITNYVETMTGGETPAWTHIPREKAAALRERRVAWRAAYAKTLGPHTTVDTKAKNDRRGEAEAFVRPFMAQYLMFDPVTAEDRRAMRMHERDVTHTPIPAPATRPVITDLKPLGGFQVEIRFHDEPTPGSRAIPYGDNGCLLSYVWGAGRVSDYAALLQTKLMTRSPWTITLPPESQQAFLSCAARWQNEKGELGPWSDVQHVVIA
ncbi:MAG: hypothetical protein LBH85_07745 [Treponema sp.]|jgi:hypothetical protein|nr:hypothetical protein [Treponema sp.]